MGGNDLDLDLDMNQQNTSSKIGCQSFLFCTFWNNGDASWPDLSTKDDFAGLWQEKSSNGRC